MLSEWLGRPHLLEWWGPERTLDEVREKYLPRIVGDDAARPFVGTVDGAPVGYIQWYRAGVVPGWWPDDPGSDVVGIELFLADGTRLARDPLSTFRLGGATLSVRGIPPRSTPHPPAEAPPHG